MESRIELEVKSFGPDNNTTSTLFISDETTSDFKTILQVITIIVAVLAAL